MPVEKNKVKINLPASMNMTINKKLSVNACIATCFLTWGGSSFVKLRKMGALAMGFMTANSPMKTDKA